MDFAEQELLIVGFIIVFGVGTLIGGTIGATGRAQDIAKLKVSGFGPQMLSEIEKDDCLQCANM